jgi:hypothetical protein
MLEQNRGALQSLVSRRGLIELNIAHVRLSNGDGGIKDLVKRLLKITFTNIDGTYLLQGMQHGRIRFQRGNASFEFMLLGRLHCRSNRMSGSSSTMRIVMPSRLLTNRLGHGSKQVSPGCAACEPRTSGANVSSQPLPVCRTCDIGPSELGLKP